MARNKKIPVRCYVYCLRDAGHAVCLFKGYTDAISLCRIPQIANAGVRKEGPPGKPAGAPSRFFSSSLFLLLCGESSIILVVTCRETASV